MTIPVLIADSSPEFCILIRQTLEETGRYQVTPASTGAEALEIARQAPIRLAIIDFDLPDITGPDLIRQLRRIRPDLAVIAIPVSNDEEELNGVAVNGMLTKPFYLPDLPRIVAEALELPVDTTEEPPARPSAEAAPEPEPADPPPPWLADVDRAAQILTRLSLETSAEAALLTRGRRLWAYAGQLDRSQVQDLVGQIADHWARHRGRGALVRFVRVPGSTEDYMLYATDVAGELVLSMVFSAETPFGMIHREAQNLARALLTEESSVESAAAPTAGDPEPPTTPEPEAAPLPGDWVPMNPAEVEHLPFLAQLAELDLPPPDPEPPAEAAPTTEDPEPPAWALPDDWLPETARPASHLPFLETEDTVPMRPVAPPPAEPEAPPTAERPLPEAQYHLPFTCVLVPRFPEHRLVGPLAARLREWVERLCVAWDWRAERIEVRPEYLSVTLSLLPEVAPAGAVHQLRDDLSRRVLESFPELATDLPSGRFWARGYLLTAGEPPTPQRVQAFVRATRQAQGLSD